MDENGTTLIGDKRRVITFDNFPKISDYPVSVEVCLDDSDPENMEWIKLSELTDEQFAEIKVSREKKVVTKEEWDKYRNIGRKLMRDWLRGSD